MILFFVQLFDMIFSFCVWHTHSLIHCAYVLRKCHVVVPTVKNGTERGLLIWTQLAKVEQDNNTQHIKGLWISICLSHTHKHKHMHTNSRRRLFPIVPFRFSFAYRFRLHSTTHRWKERDREREREQTKIGWHVFHCVAVDMRKKTYEIQQRTGVLVLGVLVAEKNEEQTQRMRLLVIDFSLSTTHHCSANCGNAKNTFFFSNL